MKQFLDLLFRPHEMICIGGAQTTQIRPVHNIGTVPSPFFCINPLSTSRSDLNVTKFRNFLFECDNMPLDEQLAMWRAMPLQPTTLVYSGGKSYHAIYSLVEDLDLPAGSRSSIELYKAYWVALAEKLENEANKITHIHMVGRFDISCKNPSRLSRCPYYIRENIPQELVATGPLLKNEDLPLPAVKAFTPKVNSSTTTPPESVAEFHAAMPVGLQNYLNSGAILWSAPAGCYPNILKLTLWAIDATNVSRDMYVKYFMEYTYPHLAAEHYPEQKALKAINDAFRMKGA